MITIKHITVNGALIPIGKDPIILLNKADVDAYRFELYADVCRQKGIEFCKEDAHTAVIFTYKETK
jgi:hypothetical protein